MTKRAPTTKPTRTRRATPTPTTRSYPYDTFTAASVLRAKDAHVVSATRELIRMQDAVRAAQQAVDVALEARAQAALALDAWEARDRVVKQWRHGG
jgi:hypothetical protein